ncbi:hypothetical protein GCM10009677_64340 [Sphaerisporangium rubeum]
MPEMPRPDPALDWVDVVRGDMRAGEELHVPGDTEPMALPSRGHVAVGGPFANQVTPKFFPANAELSAFMRTESTHHECHAGSMSATPCWTSRSRSAR